MFKKITNCTGSHTFTVQKDEVLELQLNDLEKGSRDFHLTVVLEGDNAMAKVKGVAKTEASERKKWKILLVLHGKNQRGILELRGAADNNSCLEFDGSGIVGKTSESGNISIDEKIILLSENAKAEALPILRVETEDVSSASHSASVTPFSEEMFFFLESRGIDQEEGKKLLLDGFLGGCK